jgi:hypothetical protein
MKDEEEGATGARAGRRKAEGIFLYAFLQNRLAQIIQPQVCGDDVIEVRALTSFITSAGVL